MTADSFGPTDVAGRGLPNMGHQRFSPDEQRIEDFYLAWQESLRGLTANASTLAGWQERRNRFAYRVRRALLTAPFAGAAGAAGPSSTESMRLRACATSARPTRLSDGWVTYQ